VVVTCRMRDHRRSVVDKGEMHDRGFLIVPCNVSREELEDYLRENLSFVKSRLQALDAEGGITSG